MKFVLKLHISQVIFLKSPKNLRKCSGPIGRFQVVSVDWQCSGANDGFAPLKKVFTHRLPTPTIIDSETYYFQFPIIILCQ